MEDVIAVYELPYDQDHPVICMDESCKQLIGDVQEAIPCAPGRPERIDHEYVRNGVAEIFLEVEPLTGKRHVEVSEHRAKKDWAWWIKGMLDERYPDAVRIRLIMDNLNTHTPASLYEAFQTQEARRLAERLEIHYTPKHGSWLNMAEIEFSVLNGQCLDRRIPTLNIMQNHITVWEIDRNNRNAKIRWHFTNTKARMKLKHLYPKL
jgi:transposase